MMPIQLSVPAALFSVFLLVLTLHATPAAASPDGALLSPESVIGADGALRLDGPRGSVDLRGWRMVLGEGHVPYLIPARAASVPEVAALATWSALGDGVDGFIRALALDGSGNLYAGGGFTTAGGNTANRVAKWDGSTWSALGDGVDSAVFALAVDGSGNLYAGGLFTTAGGNAANHIAKWDGTTWSALGTGMSGSGLVSIYALAFDGSGNLYAGGQFTTAGGNSANRVAKWDGTTWSALGAGVGNVIITLAFDGSGNLYAGGSFTTAGGNAASNIAKWDGTNWSALGTGVGNTVWALAFDSSGNLYAGGQFTTAGGNTANHIAKWDGTNWSALGSGMSGSGLILSVYALALDGSGNLYAGGSFTTAGGNAANFIAKWDGTNWSALGAGMDNVVRAFAYDGGTNLHAGGEFTTAGFSFVPANNIAVWDGAGAPLPVELTTFSATTDGPAVALAWHTASETDNAGFYVEIERDVVGARRVAPLRVPGSSAADRVWESIAFVQGHGTTTEPRTYNHRVADLNPGRHRFRLKQVDFDGAFAYSPIVEAEVEVPGTHFLSAAYPNPFNNSTELGVVLARSQRVRVTLHDATGRLVRHVFEAQVPAQQMQRVVIDGAGLPSGLYLYRVVGEQFTESRPVLLQK